jgi:hypothetical protein
MIEKHYSRYIVEHSDDISRKALLQHEELQAAADNVVAFELKAPSVNEFTVS